MYISIRIPLVHQDRYLHGGCFAFARELRLVVRRETGINLQLAALWVDGAPEHAFLIDPKAQCAYDARGRHPLDPSVLGQGSLCASTGLIAPIRVKDMYQWARSMNGHNARIDIQRYVSIIRE